jgi:LL-diaminopimelate aminotransferase
MPKLNENYLQLKDSYLFSEIAHRTAAYSEKHPDKPVIRLGIGDVTRPLCECAIKALHESVDEMGQAATQRLRSGTGICKNKRCHRSLL